MYRLIGHLKTRSFRVAWILEELGVAYTRLDVIPASAEVAALNVGGKVPVLETDDGMIRDSVAIMTFLTDRHGAFTHPAGSFERARQDAVTTQILDELEGALWMAAKHSFVLPEELRVAELKPSLKWEFERNTKRVADQLGAAEYFVGDEPTVPDFLLTHVLNWAEGAKFPFENDALMAHRARMTARPAYARVMQMRG